MDTIGNFYQLARDFIGPLPQNAEWIYSFFILFLGVGIFIFTGAVIKAILGR